MKKKTWILISFLMAMTLAGGMSVGVLASVQVPQTALLGASVTKYVTPLPVFVGARVSAGSAIAISYNEFQQKVLPDSFYTTLPSSITPFPGITFNPRLGTYVWGYKVGNAPALYPGFTVEAQKGTATTTTYTNNLGTADNFPILQRYITVDQSIHWANPLNLMMDDPGRMMPYSGPQAVVPHLHGGEVRSDFDGGPDSWWTPGGEGPKGSALAAGAIRGPGYYTNVLNYPNAQEAATIWFHDHLLGGTRTNVYAGLAAFWFIRDQFDTGIAGTGLNLPAGNQEIEVVIQDRQFDTTGQWLFPDGNPPGAGLMGDPPNPSVHPFWIPEFFGDVIVVNGRSWPYFQVDPRRYRVRLLNGSNSRFYELYLERTDVPTGQIPPIYVIGTDGGLLDAPVRVSSTTTDRLIIAPGERYDLIIDFGKINVELPNVPTFILKNTANTPFPGGDPVDPATTAQLLQFRVNLEFDGNDNSFNPAAPGATLRGGANKPPAIVRMADGAGGINPAVQVSKKRQLILREIMGPGGPLEVLVNNTKWGGLREMSNTPIPGSSVLGPNHLTELPQVGSTEEWEIINTTGDAHPMHLHLVQFQLVNRETYDDVGFLAAYDAAFPGGVALDGYGPPNYYNNPNADGAIGGNPAVSPFLTPGTLTPPLPQERGWKDTAIMYPGQVTRIIVRWAPQNIAVGGVTPGQNLYPFDPTYGPGYVWHCHIIDHEDNEMMRPYIPVRNAYNRKGMNVPSYELLLLGN
ncbi:MAG: multicopper oxidase domain-containing protein [Thermodesulfobacteriota bacterium]